MSAQFEFNSLDQAFEADWPVKVNVPQDGGTVKVQKFMARFRLLTHDQAKAAIAEPDFDIDTLPRLYFVGLGKDETETFSDDMRDKMLTRAHVRLGIDKAYQEFAQGIAAKN